MSIDDMETDTSMISNLDFDANDSFMTTPDKTKANMESMNIDQIVDNNNDRNILFNEHLTNIKSLLENKPRSIQEANQQYLQLVGKKNDDLSYISSAEIRELYKYQSSKHGSHAGHELMVDIGMIGHIGSWSGVDILLRTGYGHVQPNMTIFVNGTSGGGKGAALKLGTRKLDQCLKLVHNDFSDLFQVWLAKKQKEQQENEEEQKRNQKNIKKSNKKQLRSKKSVSMNNNDLPPLRAEQTPFLDPCSDEAMEKQYIDLRWKRRMCQEVIFNAMDANNKFPNSVKNHAVIQADRLKAMYQQIISTAGWSLILVEELKDKIMSMKQEGEDAAALFFIQVSDHTIPARGYSTEGLSTPQIEGASVTAIICTTSTDLCDMIQTTGTAGTGRRCYNTYNPIRNVPIMSEILSFKRKMKQCQDNNKNHKIPEKAEIIDYMINGNDYGFKMEVHRYYQFYKFINYKQPHEDDDQSILFTAKHKVIKLNCESDIIEFQCEYLEEHPEDPWLKDIVYPKHWCVGDNNTSVRTEEKKLDDFFVDIGRESNFILSHKDEFECNELVVILANTKDVRWLRIAFNLQARKQMLKMKTAEDEFKWDPMIIDPDVAETALSLMNMMDLYTIGLSLLPSKKDQLNGYRSKHSNTSKNMSMDSMFKTNDMALKVHCFHIDILRSLIDMTCKSNDYEVKSGDLSKKFSGSTYSSYNNMTHIQLVSEELRRYGLLEINLYSINKMNSNNKKDEGENKEPSQESSQLSKKRKDNDKNSKAGGNRKWSKYLVRTPISQIKEQILKDASFHNIRFMNDQQKKAYCNKMQTAAVRYLQQHNITILNWSVAFGSLENLKAMELAK